MVDEIINRLGFNVDDALAALAKLDAALLHTGDRMRGFAQSAQGLPTITTALQKVTGAMDGGARATERLTVSWSLLARVVTTQLIVSEFGQFRRALGDAAKSAVDFEKQVALIRTIDDSGASFDQTASAVRRLSDAYNISLSDASAGVYQAISNQVGNFAESLEFTAEAAKFARATNSSLSSSVDLLSGALKSYGMNANETSKVSGLFFSVIDKGRISSAELSNALGRVGPIAAQLGVPLSDLGGAIAAISVKGSKTAETLTMYRAILSGLMKPTPELTTQLKRLGFASREAAVATLHIDGVLKELVKSTGGSSAALAKLFGNVRAIAGISSLASGFQTLADDIAAARNAGAGFAQDKWLTATTTNADAVTAQVTKLRNAMTVDLGRSVLASANDLSKWIGGADSVISVAQSAGPVLLGLGAGFLTLRGSILATRLEMAGLSKTLGLLALVPVAWGVGSSIGQFAGGKMAEGSVAQLRALDAADAKALDTFKQQQSEKRDAASKADATMIESALKTIQELNKGYLSQVSAAQTVNDQIIRSTQAALNRIISARQKTVSELTKSITESADAVVASQRRISDLQAGSQDRQFQATIGGLADPEQAIRQAQRADELSRQAASDLAKATSKESIDKALATFARAQSAGEQAATIAERTEDRNLELSVARRLQKVTDRQIDAEKALQRVQQNRIPILEAEKTKQQQIVDTLKNRAKTVVDNSKLFDKSGVLLPPETLAKQASARQTAMQAFPTELRLDVEKSLATVQARISESFKQFKIEFDVGPLQSALGRQLGSPDEVARGLTELTKKAATLRATMDEARASQQAARNTLESSAVATAGALDAIQKRLDASKHAKGTEQWDLAAAGVERFRAALADPNLNAEKLREIASAVQPLAGQFGLFNAANVTDFATALEALLQRSQALQQIHVPLPDASQLQSIEMTLNNAAMASGAIASNLWNAAAASQQVIIPQGTQGYASGGTAFLASGGRGTDTIPAMLSPGEVVINSRSAQAFAAQLTAINAGVTPVYRGDGGTVNVSVGDISVVGAKNPQETAEAVWQRIRRAARRGTI